MALLCGWAAIGSNGAVSGDVAGDQTGKEVKKGKYYQFGQSVIYRFKDRTAAENYARLIKEACENDHIGYNQAKRTTLYTQAVKNNYDIKNITTDCDCDCSSLVACCLLGVGVKVPYTMTTGTLNAALEKTGLFEKLTDDHHLQGNDLVKGDIINDPNHHVISVIIDDGSGSTIVLDKSTVTTSNEYLVAYGQAMTANAKYVALYLYKNGWSANAIAGILGNMQTESNINAGLWQSLKEGATHLGFGLVQWTPATKLIEWAEANNLDYKDIDTQLERILYEVENKIQYIPTSDYPLSFKEFTTSNESPEYLAKAFLYNYERAGVGKETQRAEQARYWYALMIKENWFNSYDIDIDDPDINDGEFAGELYDALLQTAYNMNQLTPDELRLLRQLSFGDSVRIRHTFNKNKKIGTNCYGGRLKILPMDYIIKSVRRNGFVTLSLQGSSMYQYVNPKYLEVKE